MSICIKRGIITKHKYKKGVCLNCGRHREHKENISQPTADRTIDVGLLEPMQSTEPQGLPSNEKLDEFDAIAKGLGREPQDLTPAYNKDTIKE